MKKLLMIMLMASLYSCGHPAGPTSTVALYPAEYEDGGNASTTWGVVGYREAATSAYANRVRNSVLATQKELGVNPSFSLNTVADFLAVEHNTLGKHTAFETQTFRIGKNEYSGPYQLLETDPITYSDLKIEFGNQNFYLWDTGEVAQPVYMQWDSENNRFKFSPSSVELDNLFLNDRIYYENNTIILDKAGADIEIKNIQNVTATKTISANIITGTHFKIPTVTDLATFSATAERGDLVIHRYQVDLNYVNDLYLFLGPGKANTLLTGWVEE